MPTKADRLGKRLEIVSRNMAILASNTEFGKTIIWLFSVEALLRECIRFYSDMAWSSGYKALPTGVLNRPAKRPTYRSIDEATLGQLVKWYRQFRPINRKLYRELDQIRKGRNKIVHNLMRSEDIEIAFSKLFPKSIRKQEMRDILKQIISDMKFVLDEISKV